MPGHEITSRIANPLGIELMAAGGRPDRLQILSKLRSTSGS